MQPGISERKRVADTLKSWRQQAGYSGNSLAQRLGWVQPKISKIETGKQLPTEIDIREWADVTGTSTQEAEELIQVLSRVQIEYSHFRSLFRSAGGTTENQKNIIVREATANKVVLFWPLFIPGLLQTAEYARELLSLSSGPRLHGATDDDIMDMVSVRLQRQQLALYQPRRKTSIMVLESSLYARLCSVETLLGQIDRLIGLTGLPNLELGIIPFHKEIPVIPSNGFTVYDEDFVIIETITSEIRLTDPDEIKTYLEMFEMLREAAVYGKEAVEIFRRAMDSYSNALENNA